MLYYGILTPIEYHGSLVTRRMPIAPKVGEPVLIGLFRLLCLQIDVTSSATSSSSACAACCNSLLRLRHIMCFLLRLLLCVVIPLRPACPARRRIRGLLRGKLPSPPAWTFLAPQSASISYPSTEIVNEAMAYSMSTVRRSSMCSHGRFSTCSNSRSAAFWTSSRAFTKLSKCPRSN